MEAEGDHNASNMIREFHSLRRRREARLRKNDHIKKDIKKIEKYVFIIVV